jgi:hypothetical protein
MSSPYKSGPRKLNPVSILFFIGIALAIYLAIRFAPPYWTQWQFKEKLRDACAGMYKMAHYEPALKAAELEKLQQKLVSDMRTLGIDDPDATVELDDESTPGFVIARGDYHMSVSHPVGNPTIMHFTPEARMDTKPADWGKKK